MDAAELDFADGEFDVVVFSFNGLDYLHPREAGPRNLGAGARHPRRRRRDPLRTQRPRAGPAGRRSGAQPNRLRARLVQLYSSCRLALRAFLSRSFWHGDGYLQDTATEFVNFATTPDRIRAEFAAHGLELERVVGARHPLPPQRFVEPWYYFAFRRR